jgi:high-affinity iron transporter
MLYAVMLVLREVLEASLFVSLLMALGDKLQMRRVWLLPALALGLLTSALTSHFAGSIAEQFDGVGQELLNATLFLLAMFSFVLINALILPRVMRKHAANPAPRLLYVAFTLIVIGSLTREGSEVWIYLSSFQGQAQSYHAATMGGLIGAGIGVSLGVLVYLVFSAVPKNVFFPLFFALTTLIVCGLSMQLAKLGLQIGWLDSGDALWDSGGLINERSWVGQFLHALFGYDANPDRVQVGFYAAALIATAFACLVRYRYFMRARISSTKVLLLCSVFGAHAALADTNGVYSPYVNQTERELEYGLVLRGIGDNAVSLQRLSASYAWNDHFASEIYVFSETLDARDQRLRGYEAELLWQIGEQGQYWADYGLLFEYEHFDGDLHELSAGLLVERQLSQRWLLSVNTFLEYEVRRNRPDEFETALYARLRFLYRRSLEPALELYLDDTDYAFGPALSGSGRLAPGKQLRWSLGLPLGFTRRSPDISLRAAIEFEF